MRSARSPFVWIALGVPAALLLLLAGYIGLGWAVWSDQPWAYWILGYTRFERVHDAYQHAMENFFSGDRDGDGVRDGQELWERSDPLNPKQHAGLVIEWDTDGFRAWGTFGIDSDLPGTGTAAHKFLFPSAGTRLPVRGGSCSTTICRTLFRPDSRCASLLRISLASPCTAHRFCRLRWLCL
jgi:hypothetical protein